MGVIDEILSGFVVKAGDSFLRDYAKDTVNDCYRWAEFEGRRPEELLDKVCQFRLREWYKGDKLLRDELCKFDFVDKAEGIVEEFGRENALALLKEKGNSTDRNDSAVDVLAVFIISESLPESNRVAEYVAAKIRERKDWKYLVTVFPAEAE